MFLLRDDINEISGLVLKGNILCYPTDTVWGIGCDATNDAAVKAVRQIKQHPEQEGMIILVNSIEMLKQYVSNLPPRIETLHALHRRPFTLIYEEPKGISPSLFASNGSIAIRVTYDNFCSDLINLIQKPLVSTMAAMNGTPFPPNFGAVSSDILGNVDYVVKHRQDEKRVGAPSPLAKLDQFQELEFIRE